jgi:hypothetical protein
MFTAGALVVATFLMAPDIVAVGQDQLAAAETAAKANAESADGKAFAESVGQAFGRDHGATIQQCAKKAKRGDLSNFDVFLRLDGAGAVDDALVNPATTLSTCVKDKMPGWKVSAPKAAGYWVKIAVNLKGK